MDSIDYYNRYAVPYYEETVDASMEEVMKPFVELLSEESENAEVLDLGCGSGRDTLLLEEYGFYVTPMDGSEEMCKLAEVNTDKEVLQMTYDEMEFDDVFDGIWACASLIHLTEDEMRKVIDFCNSPKAIECVCTNCGDALRNLEILHVIWRG